MLPLTAPTAVATPNATIPPSTIKAHPLDLCAVTFGDYNVRNLAYISILFELISCFVRSRIWRPPRVIFPLLPSHIVNYLNTPDIMYLQEIQDNSGPTDNGVVDANVTLNTLISAIAKISNVTYSFATINPVDGQDGGQPGGNIRTAYLQVLLSSLYIAG